MTGAHLDSVSAGPGINDNGTGSAAVLEAALQWAGQRQHLAQPPALRVVGRGGAGPARVQQVHVAAADGRQGPHRPLPELRHGRLAQPRLLRLRRQPGRQRRARRDDGLLHVEGHPLGVHRRAGPLRPRVVPQLRHRRPTGMYTGGETTKTSAQASKWGGTAGAAFDPCYHRSCDTIANIDTTALDRNIDMIGHMVWLYADKDFGTTDPAPERRQPARQPGLRVRRDGLGRHHRRDHDAAPADPRAPGRGRRGSAATAPRRRRTSPSRSRSRPRPARRRCRTGSAPTPRSPARRRTTR